MDVVELPLMRWMSVFGISEGKSITPMSEYHNMIIMQGSFRSLKSNGSKEM
jgi:hypothetical protein